METELKTWETFRYKLKQQGRKVNEHPLLNFTATGSTPITIIFSTANNMNKCTLSYIPMQYTQLLSDLAKQNWTKLNLRICV